MKDWISVSTMLPEEGQEVLITFINEAGKHVAESTYTRSKFFYVAETDNGYYEEVFSTVIAWQPLPEPSEEEAK